MRVSLQSRSSASADAMLDACLTLLSTGGLGAVTVAEVARASGVSNGSLYYRFGDRTGLLVAAQDRLLSSIEVETAVAFASADACPDNDEAVLLLSRAAVAMYAEHRLSVRAFLVEGASEVALEPRNDAYSHAIARTITGWLVDRLGAAPADAEAAYRIIHALGVTQALLDEPRVSPVVLSPDTLADALARAVLAVVGR